MKTAIVYLETFFLVIGIEALMVFYPGYMNEIISGRYFIHAAMIVISIICILLHKGRFRDHGLCSSPIPHGQARLSSPPSTS